MFNSKNKHEEEILHLNQSFQLESQRLQEELYKRSLKLNKLSEDLHKFQARNEETDKMKKTYIEKFRDCEKKLREFKIKEASEKDSKRKLEKECKDLRQNLKFKEKHLLKIDKDGRRRIQQLEMILKVQKENNREVINKMKKHYTKGTFAFGYISSEWQGANK